ncbi:hypothetical protein [Haloferax chudinovii]|uniref:DUF2680 domain-containing protein n=1 Tax=Haloferax chudinovii TaxID=1109010 RepID=A0ABD5XI99_9EURY
MTRLTTLGVALVVASLVFAGTAAAGFAVQTHASDAVQATDGTAVRPDGGWHGPFAGTADETRDAPGDHLHDRSNLTDEQADEIRTLVADMRADGATTDQIRTAVHETLAEFGVDTSALACDGDGDGDGIQVRAGGRGGFGPRGD